MANKRRVWLSEQFNKVGTSTIELMTDPKAVGRTCLLGLTLMPFFGYATGIGVLAAPTVFTGIGYGCRMVSRLLSNSTPKLD